MSDFVRRNIDGLLIDISQPQSEERDTKTIAGKFAEALGCLEDASCYLRDIDKQYVEFYRNDDECTGLELEFWWGVSEAAMALTQMLQDLKDVEKHMPKEGSV